MNNLVQFLARVRGKPSTVKRAPSSLCAPAVLEPMEARRLMAATPTMLANASPPGDGENQPTQRVFIKSWSTSGDADDRPTEEVAFYYNKIAFNYASTRDGL